MNRFFLFLALASSALAQTVSITAPVTLNAVGQQLVGHGLTSEYLQTTTATNGFDFRVGTGTLTPGGAGLYWNGARNLALTGANDNTGTGISIGVLTEPTHNGDYWTGRDLFISKWGTGIHFHSMAMGWLDGVLINNETPTPGDFGIRVTGGSSNSHLWTRLAMANVALGVSWETPGFGNVVMQSDFGAMQVAYDIYGGQLTVIGGNDEATITDLVFNVRSSATLGTFGVGGQGTRTNPAFNLGGGYGRLIHIHTAIGYTGTVLVTGAGYGNSMGLEIGLAADAQFDDAGPKWKDLPFPAYYSNALPDPASASVGAGAVIHCIGVSSHRHGLLQKTYDATTSAWRWEWLNSGIFE